jgi:hypothetical protein
MEYETSEEKSSSLCSRTPHISEDERTMNSLELTRKFLKGKLIKDNLSFFGHEKELTHVKNLFQRALEGESNSALLIAEKFGGKTTVCTFPFGIDFI